ncbi:aminopeptidase N-like [Anoplophora glabripennis]|uniref:aminopeptidase N-like n=1 Tax=Anoplophora glabripennis TaxID=217634 RepID=UPI000A12AF31|nr:aminopeptidase N-like [Anoplophora glabripennis]
MTLLLLLASLCIGSVLAVPTVRDDEPEENYKLDQAFKLTSYDLALTVPKEAFTDKGTEYTGKVTIIFSFTEIKEYITLHAHSDFIGITNVNFNNYDLEDEDYSLDNVTNILKVKAVNGVSIDRSYQLIIEFTGRLSTEDMYGFYKSTYVDGEETKYLVTTQFEPTHARKAFPCFDEPSFKATFTLSITYPSTQNALFNTKELDTTTDKDAGTKTTNFAATPVMSTYLVAFIVSEFTCTSGDPVDGAVFQVCSRDELADTRKRAAEVGSKVIEKLNEYTGISYSKSMEKMDQVAIPDFSAGAMENWGLVTYREASLLWDEKESSNRYNQRVTTVIAHEFAHLWFGDLVTCNWWSEIFLNEGFATYFEYHIANEVTSKWELDKQFLIEQVHSALVADALTNSQALQSEVTTPTEISDKFGTISYNKGGSVLRMVANFLGLDKFKEGLQKYLTAYSYKTAEPEDLWNSLDGISDIKLPADKLTEVMENWVKNPGFPLVTVKLNEDKINLSQERFLLSGTDAKSKWYVPITVTSSQDKNKFETTTATTWLTPTDDVSVAISNTTSWVVVNNQQTGYYRVNYDDTLWNRIKAALDSEEFGGIVELNRAQIIDDLFNLARTNKTQYTLALNIASYLSNETSYYPWYAAFNGYDFLLRRVGDSKLGKAISSNLLDQLSELYKSVPFSKVNADDQIYTHKQVLALTWACKLGNQDCVEQSTMLFQEYKGNGTMRPDRNLRSIVYCNGLRYSENKTDWKFLWDAYLDAGDLATEQVTILAALGCTKDTELLKEYLEKTITDDSGIRSQDASAAFSSVYSNNPEGIAVAYDFLKNKYEEIAEKYQSMNSLGNLIKGIAERFTTEKEVNDLNDFVGKEGLPEAFKSAAKEAVETAKANLEWKKKFEEDLTDFYTTSTDAASGIHASFAVTLVAIVISKLFFL